MIIPFEELLAPITGASSKQEHALHTVVLGGKSGGTVANWSSLIGIITAIVGNILISFALNTQRYAHVRLEKEHQAQQRAYKDRKRNGMIDGYGSIATNAAEERAKKNAGAAWEPDGKLNNGNGERYGNAYEDGERDALIPPIHILDSDRDSTSSDDESTNTELERKSYLKSPYWWIGIILMTLGEAGNFLAYGFAPASIVSPLGVVAIISNCLIAPIMLKERFRARDLLGVIIAVGGAVTVVLSAKTSNPRLGPQQIWHLITRWEFETYLGITTAAILLLMVASNKYGEKTIAIDLGLVGLFGGYTALSTKGVASLLSYALWKTPTYPITYLLILVLVLTAVMQIKYVNRALQRFDSTQVIPTQFVIFTIFVITGSAVLYRDFEETTAEQAGKFVGGCALTFLGVWCITSGRNTEHEHDGEIQLGDDDDGEVIDLVDDEHDTHDATAADSSSTARLPPTTPPPPSTPKPKPSQYPNTPRINAVFDSPASFATAPSTPFRPSHPPASTSTPHLRSPSPNKPTTESLRPPPSPLSGRPPTSPSLRSKQTSDTLLPLEATAPSPHLLSRRSITAGMRPGPLTAPLSSSLSAVVASTLQRQGSLGGAGGGVASGRRRRSSANKTRERRDDGGEDGEGEARR